MLLKLDWYRFVSFSNKIILCTVAMASSGDREQLETANNPHSWWTEPEVGDGGAGDGRWEETHHGIDMEQREYHSWPPSTATAAIVYSKRPSNGRMVDSASAFSACSIRDQVKWNQAWQINGSSKYCRPTGIETFWCCIGSTEWCDWVMMEEGYFDFVCILSHFIWWRLLQQGEGARRKLSNNSK